MADCLFCKIVAGAIPAEVTYRNDDIVAFKDINPQAPFHELVIPARHMTLLSDARPDDATLLGRLMLVATERAHAAGFAPDGDEAGFRVAMNSGAGSGQSVFHVHLHVLAGRPFTWPPG